MGSVQCLEFGTDLNLNPLLCSGVRGNFQYSAQVTYRDVRDAGAPAVSYTLYTVMIPEGVLTVEDQLVSISVGSLTEEIVSQAPWAPHGYQMEVRNYYGGGFLANLWSGLKKAFKVVAPVARGVADVVGKIAPMLPHPAAAAIGTGANVVGNVLRATGNGRTGGRRMRTSSLARRL